MLSERCATVVDQTKDGAAWSSIFLFHGRVLLGLDRFSIPTAYLYIWLGSRDLELRPHNSSHHTREGMHIYSYDGCDSDSSGSNPLSSPDSETDDPQFHRSLIILLDDDDDEDEFEQPAHPLPSHRPKRPLPRRFSRKYHSPVKEATAQGNQMSHPGVDHTMSYTPGLHGESLKVCLFLKSSIGHPKFRRRSSGWNATSPWGNLPNQSAAGWEITHPVFYPGVNRKKTRHPKPVR